MTSTPPVPPKAPALNLALLASRAAVVKELPKPTRRPGGTAALSALVERSYRERMVFELPAVTVPDGSDPAKVTATLVAAVRRAAALVQLGVSVRSQLTDRGVVVTFQGKRRSMNT